ncbi:MerR family transcriptional regulator [Prosthecomicrobium sp. N25]|uniref:MerR family transcriptional regulator n=1 Tax=Prosthecomicrobium sp. N25 TaxID=3129254 RepID=UPI0030776D27
MDKSPDAFRTISEVASDLDLPQHVLRFWETKFSQIKPLKRGGGRRYYRPDDVELLKGIRHLLYGEGYTIRGVQRILKENGVRFVMNVWREGAPQPNAAGPAADAHDIGAYEPAYADAYPGEGDLDEAYEAEDAAAADLPAHADPSAAAIAQRFAPRGPADDMDRVVGQPRDLAEAPAARAVGFHPVAPMASPLRAARAAQGGLAEHETGEHRSALGSLIDRFRGAGRGEHDPSAPPPLNKSLSREEIRRLQATLFELLECKRLLDQAR